MNLTISIKLYFYVGIYIGNWNNYYNYVNSDGQVAKVLVLKK